VTRAGLPERALPGKPGGQQPVICQLGQAESAVHSDQARAVREQVAQRQRFLAAAGELGPVTGHAAVQGQHPVLYEQRDD
jgi:hypothetical protein